MRAPRLVALSMMVPLCVASVAGQTTGVREVTASERSVIPLNTKLRFTTMVVLPDGEEILDVICGDRDFWVISATQNIAHVKPAKDAAATNLNLVTTSGAIYSFLLTESKNGQPDLKVYVTADPDIAARAKPKYYSATQVSALQDELSDARAAIQTVQLRSEEALAAFQREYPAALVFAYGTPKYEKPFFVRSIWHDGQFTYIRSDARELPTLYEVRDGQPSLVNFQVQSGMYVVPKVLDRGYLAVGKERFSFQQGQ
jgi:type IV secretory pathway VirB9-like protein